MIVWDPGVKLSHVSEIHYPKTSALRTPSRSSIWHCKLDREVKSKEIFEPEWNISSNRDSSDSLQALTTTFLLNNAPFFVIYLRITVLLCNCMRCFMVARSGFSIIVVSFILLHLYRKSQTFWVGASASPISSSRVPIINLLHFSGGRFTVDKELQESYLPVLTLLRYLYSSSLYSNESVLSQVLNLSTMIHL